MPANIKSYLTLFKTIYPATTFSYMSCPITGGPTFINWYNEVGKKLEKDSKEYQEQFYKNVVEVNEENARMEANRIYLRLSSDDIIINPVEFDAEFSQAEYILFWTEFITKYAKKVIFIPGWEYSHGALAEYMIAMNNGISTYDHLLLPISKKYVLQKLEVAIDFLNALKMKTDLQENIIKLLKNE